jgi:long-subunit fatty acid transport protein
MINAINWRKSILILFALVAFLQAYSQESENKSIRNTTPVFTLNTNLLYDVTTNLNLGVEFKLADKFTLKLPVTYNPFTFKDDRKTLFILVQPELRWWLCESFSGHFLGLHAHYATYDVAGVGNKHTKDYRYDGELYGGGISYGYHFYLAPRWILEASVGAGYAYLEYDKYKFKDDKTFIGSEHKNYVGLTELGISISYIIK